MKIRIQNWPLVLLASNMILFLGYINQESKPILIMVQCVQWYMDLHPQSIYLNVLACSVCLLGPPQVQRSFCLSIIKSSSNVVVYRFLWKIDPFLWAIDVIQTAFNLEKSCFQSSKGFFFFNYWTFSPSTFFVPTDSFSTWFDESKNGEKIFSLLQLCLFESRNPDV